LVSRRAFEPAVLSFLDREVLDMSSAAEARRPTHVPPGFKFRTEIRGETGLGFSGDPAQVGLIYARGRTDEDRLFPLTLHVSSRRRARLIGTEQHRGRRITLRRARAQATYHDGMWKLGHGPSERRVAPGTVIHWDSSDVHSLTLTAKGRVFAVRGARSRGIELQDLVRTLESVL
jgi:hypothetical protein